MLHEQNVGINDNAFVKRQYFNWFPAIWTVPPTIDFIASIDELRRAFPDVNVQRHKFGLVFPTYLHPLWVPIQTGGTWMLTFV